MLDHAARRPGASRIPEHRNRGRLFDAALTVGATAGVICLLAALATWLFGITPLIVRSNSMAPSMPTGSLALARDVPAHEVSTGDIVSVISDTGARVTHRVTDIGERTGNSVPLTLKGDANTDTDITPYVVTDVQRVFLDVPWLGYVVAWTSTPTALAAGALLSAWLLWAVFRPRSARSIRKETAPDSDDPGSGHRLRPPHDPPESPIRYEPHGRHRAHPPAPDSRVSGSGWRMGPAIVLVSIMVASVMSVGEPPARASVTDIAAARVSAAMGTVPRAASLTCTTEGSSVININTAVLSWPTVGPGYSYRLIFRGTTPAPEGSYDVPAQATGTVTVRLTREVLSSGLLPILIFDAILYTVLPGTSWTSTTLTRRINKTEFQSRCDPAGTTTAAGIARVPDPVPSASTSSPAPSADNSSTAPTSDATPDAPDPGASESSPTTPMPPQEGEIPPAPVPELGSSSSSTTPAAYR